MYNTKKVCPDEECGWSRTYDRNRDTFGVGRNNFCPICGKPLEEKPYSPNL